MILKTHIPVERLPGPSPADRRCPGCGCYLSTWNPSEVCAPCSPGNDWQEGDKSPEEILQLQRDYRSEQVAA